MVAKSKVSSYVSSNSEVGQLVFSKKKAAPLVSKAAPFLLARPEGRALALVVTQSSP